MSFRLFIYYCAAWGACAAFTGWALGLGLSVNMTSVVSRMALMGTCLGILVAFGLGIVDTLLSGTLRQVGLAVMRIGVAVVLGALGGALGATMGQGLYLWLQWGIVLVFGWTLTGALIGPAPGGFDYLAAMIRNEDRRGATRKLRNGLIGGTVGGVVGGILYLVMLSVWSGLFRSIEAQELWSPTATGLVALGTCIGLAVATAQVVLKEAWLRVEAGFRPGRQLILTKPEVTIGRSEGNDVGLFGDAGIEKVHARIVRQGNAFVLEDRGTAGGTLLNGERVNAPTPLKSGDRIQVGGSILSFGERRKEPAPG